MYEVLVVYWIMKDKSSYLQLNQSINYMLLLINNSWTVLCWQYIQSF